MARGATDLVAYYLIFIDTYDSLGGSFISTVSPTPWHREAKLYFENIDYAAS